MCTCVRVRMCMCERICSFEKLTLASSSPVLASITSTPSPPFPPFAIYAAPPPITRSLSFSLVYVYCVNCYGGFLHPFMRLNAGV